jgi:type VI secretion system protein ImpH
VATKKRQKDHSLTERLFKEFHKFSFFKTISLLESIYPDKEPLGESLEPAKEPVSIKVKPGLAFPAADISSLEDGVGGRPSEMSVTFMGLIGPSGILPHWYNELALERIKLKDYSLTSFFDIFHHRLISLLYLAWKKHRFPENYKPGGKDRLTSYLLSLCGLGTPGLSNKIGLPPESLAFYTGLLSMPSPNTAGIEDAVSYLSGVKACVDQFIERIISLSPEDQTCIGLANSRLGEDAICGSYIWDCETKFRVNLGPMSYKDFRKFLPNGAMLGPIFSLIRYMVGIEYEFDLNVILSHDQVPACILGSDSQLGLTTWLFKPGIHPVHDVFITIGESSIAHN